jgi:uncharacterized membrane protein
MNVAALAQKKQRYRTYLPSTIYKTYEMSNLLAFAKYVPHLVAVETLVMVIAIVIVILLLHGCGDMVVVR